MIPPARILSTTWEHDPSKLSKPCKKQAASDYNILQPPPPEESRVSLRPQLLPPDVAALLPGVRKDEIGIMQLLQATESAVEHRDEYLHECYSENVHDIPASA